MGSGSAQAAFWAPRTWRLCGFEDKRSLRLSPRVFAVASNLRSLGRATSLVILLVSPNAAGSCVLGGRASGAASDFPTAKPGAQ